ncbi:NAD(P)-binding oxidoreductase [Nocardia jiangxiensis]|uniref:NAD(P)-binding oxidoreductase n=1 Tax=Nocardia jiangxiensis TaxID=282685 RepID=A0ABW6S488_9NOCA|nr:NAD(P)-binding oxidoreductase [Nocardia jiangxiensis]
MIEQSARTISDKEGTSMKVFQIGAAGGVGRPLAALLHARGDEVTGMHRRPEQAAVIAETGATPLAGDLIADSVDELAEKFSGHDAVVFSAGAHGTGQDQTTAIDGAGLEKAAEAARRAGVARFVLVSVFPDAGRGRATSEGFEHYMRVKKTADVYLTHTDLDWLIVRPGTLRDEPGNGCVTAGLAIEYGDVHRDGVAAFIDAALHRPDLNRVVVELTDGPTPAADAVDALIATTGPRTLS